MTLPERQLHLAVALGCERIICLVQDIEAPSKRLREYAERTGLKFHTIDGPHKLLSLISANDELLVVTERLLFDAEVAVAVLARGNCVVVLPVEPGTAAGFERIDLNRAWAGMLWMPGHLVERISQLPSDCDASAALLRIALQGHVPDRNLPEAVLTDHRWTLIKSGEQLAQIENDWLHRRLASPGAYAPGRSFAALVTRRLIPRMLDRGWLPQTVKGSGVAVGGAGVAAAAAGISALGIAAICVGWILLEAGGTLGSIRALGLPPERSPRRAFLRWDWPMDICLVAAIALGLAGSWSDRVFAPAVMLAFIRLAEAIAHARWTELARDRVLLSGVLAFAAAIGILLPAVQVICAGWIVLLFVSLRSASRLTQP